MWIVQTNFIKETQVKPLVEALNEYGIPFQDVGIIPFSDEFITPLEHDRKDLIPYGSTSLMRIAMKRGWKGLFFDHERFTVACWNKNRNDMLNQDVDITTVKYAMEKFASVDPDSVWFVRPNSDLKRFNGTLTTAKEISRWIGSVEAGNFQFGEEELIAISAPRTIRTEYRIFVVGGKVVTGSMYKFEGLKLESRADAEVLRQAQELADGWLPHETCVMDIAYEVGASKFKVVEFNCLNASGFYYHDIRAFAHAVTQYFATMVDIAQR